MDEGVIYTLKDVLSYIENSDNKTLRVKALEFAMELLSEIEMDFEKAEKALKAEVAGRSDEANLLIEKILDDLDKVEYDEEE